MTNIFEEFDKERSGFRVGGNNRTFRPKYTEADVKRAVAKVREELKCEMQTILDNMACDIDNNYRVDICMKHQQISDNKIDELLGEK